MLSTSWPETTDRGATRRPVMRATFTDHVLLACVVGVPFLLGGRLEFARFIFVGLAALAGLAWGVSGVLSRQQVVVRSASYFVLLAAAAIAVLQSVSLPPAVVDAISPRIAAAVIGAI